MVNTAIMEHLLDQSKCSPEKEFFNNLVFYIHYWGYLQAVMILNNTYPIKSKGTKEKMLFVA